MGDNANYSVVNEEGEDQQLTQAQLDELSQFEDVGDETMVVLGQEVPVPKQDDAGRKFTSCHDVMRALDCIVATTTVQMNAKARAIVLVQTIIDFISEHVAEPQQGGRGGRGRARGRGGGHTGGRGSVTASDAYVL